MTKTEKEIKALMITDLLTKTNWPQEVIAHMAGHKKVSGKKLKLALKDRSKKRFLFFAR